MREYNIKAKKTTCVSFNLTNWRVYDSRVIKHERKKKRKSKRLLGELLIYASNFSLACFNLLFVVLLGLFPSWDSAASSWMVAWSSSNSAKLMTDIATSNSASLNCLAFRSEESLWCSISTLFCSIFAKSRLVSSKPRPSLVKAAIARFFFLLLQIETHPRVRFLNHPFCFPPLCSQTIDFFFEFGFLPQQLISHPTQKERDVVS